jgi:Zn-dependent peptidase ImmA (M78 family)
MIGDISINATNLTWAIARAGYELDAFCEKFPDVQKWINGEKKPTFKQLETFSKKVYLPLGYLFLKEPPKEKLPIPYFRTTGKSETVSLNVYDTILLLQQRQDWLKNYLIQQEFGNLDYVGKYKDTFNVQVIVDDIRSTLGLEDNWAGNFKTWEEAQEHLISHVENAGIIVVFNGVVENNGHRKIPVEECRGFVLVDKIAPFMFINNADWKSAQMFTILHELAHVWTGQSAGFDFNNFQPANDPIEKLCDQVAAEFLVPRVALTEFWETKVDIKKASKFFKVSEIVIARRALDLGIFTKKRFLEFYDEYSQREFIKKSNQSSGGDFYATTKKRLSITYAAHINNAIKSGDLLHRDAYKLTSLKGDTFQNFFTKHF